MTISFNEVLLYIISNKIWEDVHCDIFKFCIVSVVTKLIAKNILFFYLLSLNLKLMQLYAGMSHWPIMQILTGSFNLLVLLPNLSNKNMIFSIFDALSLNSDFLDKIIIHYDFSHLTWIPSSDFFLTWNLYLCDTRVSSLKP